MNDLPEYILDDERYEKMKDTLRDNSHPNRHLANLYTMWTVVESIASGVNLTVPETTENILNGISAALNHLLDTERVVFHNSLQARRFHDRISARLGHAANLIDSALADHPIGSEKYLQLVGNASSNISHVINLQVALDVVMSRLVQE